MAEISADIPRLGIPRGPRGNGPIWRALVLFVAVLLMLLLIHGSIGCNPYAAGWRACAAVQDAGNRTDDALAAAYLAKSAKCVKEHGSKTQAYAACIAPYRKVLTVWVSLVRPAVSTALRAAVASLQIAERVKGGETNWLVLLKPGVCALARAVGEWAHLMGKAAAQVRGYLGLVEGVTCE